MAPRIVIGLREKGHDPYMSADLVLCYEYPRHGDLYCGSFSLDSQVLFFASDLPRILGEGLGKALRLFPARRFPPRRL